MKKFLIILSVVIITLGALIGVYVSTGGDFGFVDTYVENFKENLFNLRLKYELQKSEHEDEEMLSEETDNPLPNTDETNPSFDADNETHDSKAQAELKYEFVLSQDPIAVNSASTARYARFGDGILCVLENGIDFYDKSGNKKWTRAIQLSNPVLKVNSGYFLVFEQGGTKISVYNERGEVCSFQTVEKILNANISSQGDSAVITEKSYYKGAVLVYNKSGEEIFSRSFGSESPISCAISDTRKLAVSLLSVRTQAYSKIVFLDINKTDEEVSLEYENCVIFELDYSGNDLIAFGDNKIISLNARGREEWTYEYNDRTLKNHSKDSSNIRLLLFDNNNNAEMSVLAASGKEKQTIKTDVIPDFCDICDGMVVYNNKRELFLSKLNGEQIAKYFASRDISKVYFIDSENILAVYNQSLEFLHTKKIPKTHKDEVQ